MAKFKVGDVVKPVSFTDIGYHFKLIPDSEYKVLEEDNGVLTVEGKFFERDSGDGEGWAEGWFELADSAQQLPTAESLRNFILEVRSKREALQKEILQSDEQEKEALEKLKELGFLLANNPIEESGASCVKVGDIVRCISVENPGYNIGSLGTSLDVLYTVDHVYGEVDGKQKVSIEERVGGLGLVGVNYEFHSRPVK